MVYYKSTTAGHQGGSLRLLPLMFMYLKSKIKKSASTYQLCMVSWKVMDVALVLLLSPSFT